MYARPRNKRRVYGRAGVQRNLVLRFHRTFGVLWKKVNRLKPRALHRWGYRMWLHRYHVRITGWEWANLVFFEPLLVPHVAATFIKLDVLDVLARLVHHIPVQR